MIPKINRVIRVLITTDILIYSAWGLVTPIFAVFIVDSINGGDAQVAGMAAGIYWVIKSLLQFPIGKYLDTNDGERDDYWFLIAGTFLSAVTPLGFLFSSEPWHLYLIQAVYAVGMSMVIPAWGGIFTRHMDKGLEAETWGLESSSLGLGVGIAGFAGGFLATKFGYRRDGKLSFACDKKGDKPEEGRRSGHHKNDKYVILGF